MAKTPYLDFWYSVLEIFQYRIPAWDEATHSRQYGTWGLWRQGKGEVAPLVIARFFDDGRSIQMTSVIPDGPGLSHAALAKSVRALVEEFSAMDRPVPAGTLPSTSDLTALTGAQGRKALKAATREKYCDAWNTVGDHGLLGSPSAATLAYVSFLSARSADFEDLPPQMTWNARTFTAARSAESPTPAKQAVKKATRKAARRSLKKPTPKRPATKSAAMTKRRRGASKKHT